MTFDDPEEFDDSADANLIVTDVPADTGVGAYELEVSYDPDAVALDISGTDRFIVESETEENQRDTVTVVGYTGDVDETPGTLMLAELTVTGIADGETDLRIEAIETFADVDGEAIDHDHDDLTLEIDSDTNGGPTNGGSGGSGGGAPPVSDSDDDEETDDTVTDDPATDDSVEDDSETPAPTTDDSAEDDAETPDPATDDSAEDEDTIPGLGISITIFAVFAGLAFVIRTRELQ
ncbi:hypothetical protein EA472_02895 [Natrarchaeobius oligotrophus]|uniref:Cohesin domain-containing protein n=1 Tax=Natrarchaeobius chitinivorans TaxID=1679083 RepID=A0A3N6MLE1_NATCH|nr:hypothetical protein EA472_02895 [Natrarchaeobius chitinivorans]